MSPNLLTLILLPAALAAAQWTNTNLQTKFPTATVTTHLAAVRTIAAGATFDGGMAQWDRNPSTCQGQTETGEKDAVFILENGATLSNLIIGPNNGEGVHCRGACTLNNIWWTDVCEDAATFKQSSRASISYVNGGGARHASDKVFQHNGAGTIAVKNFFASDIKTMYRSCGNCGTQVARHSTFTNIRVVDGAPRVVAGVNRNYGDTTRVVGSCLLAGAAACWVYEGNNQGKEPTKISNGPDGWSAACVVSGVRNSGC